MSLFLSLLTDWLRFFRFPNLVMVALTQYLVQYVVLVPAFRQGGLMPELNGWHFFLFVLDTVLIAAGGYLINDIADVEIDILNKPEKTFVGRIISKQNALRIYWGVALSGLVIALILAFYVNNLPLVLIYPAAVWLLHAYSFSLKKKPLIGNLVVSFFCAFVVGIVLFAERHSLEDLAAFSPDIHTQVKTLLGSYLLFAFFTTLIREIIKDMEDMKGDEALGLRTIPIVWGEHVSKSIVIACAIFVMTGLGISFLWLVETNIPNGIAALSLLLLMPMAYLAFYLRQPTGKAHFTRMSRWMKGIMAVGLLLLLLTGKFLFQT